MDIAWEGMFGSRIKELINILSKVQLEFQSRCITCCMIKLHGLVPTTCHLLVPFYGLSGGYVIQWTNAHSCRQ